MAPRSTTSIAVIPARVYRSAIKMMVAVVVVVVVVVVVGRVMIRHNEVKLIFIGTSYLC